MKIIVFVFLARFLGFYGLQKQPRVRSDGSKEYQPKTCPYGPLQRQLDVFWTCFGLFRQPKTVLEAGKPSAKPEILAYLQPV